ncbi:zinc finger protein [Culex quinquefasciatus]|uniref:Zinc finger protein n=2 Tax=Culex pipiens complex TaxID=518105 RepID=B0WQZ5_CULQU|nr:zinc finger protein [Culex quinquefasciatus]|eukprot:XP_001851129.1 zinc finger protein [Culex quinquefasciatus]
MRVHTGARPYACTYCDRTFTQSNDLTLHIRRHTGEKPYSCPICNERFIQGTALRAHQRSVGHITEETLLPVSNYGRSLLEG